MATPPVFLASAAWQPIVAQLQAKVADLETSQNKIMKQRELEQDHYALVVANSTKEATARADAEAALARAEKEARHARAVFEHLHAHHIACNGNGSMNGNQDVDWENGVKLQKELEAEKETNKQHRAEITKLEGEKRVKIKELENAHKNNHEIKGRITTLEQRLEEEKSKRDEQTKIGSDIAASLEAAYEDLSQRDKDCRTLRNERDTIDAEREELSLKLKEAEDYCQRSQRRIAELEKQEEHLKELEEAVVVAQADNDSLQDILNERDRVVLVKDARIGFLEAQLQKALLRNTKSENATDDPVAAEQPSTTDLGQGSSLADELEHASDAGDFRETTPEPLLELGSVVSVVDIAPVEATEPKAELLSTTIATVADVKPQEHQKTSSTSGTQTQQPELSYANTTTTFDLSPTDVTPVEVTEQMTQTDGPELSYATAITTLDMPAIEATEVALVEVQDQHTQTESPMLSHVATSTMLDYSPVDEEQVTQMEPAQLSHAATSTIIDVSPIAPILFSEHITQTNVSADLNNDSATEPFPPFFIDGQDAEGNALASIHVDHDTEAIRTHNSVDKSTQATLFVIPSVSPGQKRVLSFSTALAIFFGFLSLLYYIENEDMYNRGISSYNNGGPLHRGRHLFNMVPLCYGEGSTWITEQFCQQFATGVQVWESMLGIEQHFLI